MSGAPFVRSGSRMLRCGYTTGTCAAIAAAGAARLLLLGSCPETLTLELPSGDLAELPLEKREGEPDAALCAVRKDAGDDPDVTDGLPVCARVERIGQGVEIDGGEGVGRVTKPGLDQPVGAAAINSVPRRMIREAVEAVCREAGYTGGLRVVVSIPGGAAVAQKTFNASLGIEGGLSILGTSGLVEPMSEKALVDTIALELHQARLRGDRVILVPGNYGMDYLLSKLPELGALPRVKVSNYIGEALDLSALEGFQELLLVGHIGKLVKLAGGIMNTHSRVADCRMELFCAHAALCGADRALCRALMEQVSCDGCLALLEDAGLREPVMASLTAAMQRALQHRCGDMTAGVVCFSLVYGLLGQSAEAQTLLKKWREERGDG